MLFDIFYFGVGLVLLVWASYQDILERRVSGWFSIGFFVLSWFFVSWELVLLSGGVALFFGWAMTRLGVWGEGDVQLAVGLSCYLGSVSLVILLFTVLAFCSTFWKLLWSWGSGERIGPFEEDYSCPFVPCFVIVYVVLWLL